MLPMPVVPHYFPSFTNQFRTFQYSDPQIKTGLRERLNQSDGYVVIKGFPLRDNYEDICRHFTRFCERIGPLTGHGASQAKIWPVTPRSKLSHVPTFSETASEAPLHTDNSWVQQPERYFALLVVRPAADGGESIVLSVNDVLIELAKTRAGQEAIQILREPSFPYSMPDVFLGSGTFCSVVVAPILEGHNNLRYRYDTIQSGFSARPDLATPERLGAVEILNQVLESMLRYAPRMKLDAGDILLANNHTVLHARTEFSDPDRLLLRARMMDVQGDSFLG